MKKLFILIVLLGHVLFLQAQQWTGTWAIAMQEQYQSDWLHPNPKGFQNWNYLVLNMLAWLEGRNVIKEF